MLKTPLAIFAVAATMAAAPTATLAGPPRPLKATAAFVGGTVLGAVDPTTTAVRASDGTVLVLRDAAPQRALPAPPGCKAGAVGSGLIAWDCGDLPVVGDPPLADQHLRLVVMTDPAGAELGRVAVPFAYELTSTVAVGTQWVQHALPDPNGKARGGIVWTNWHTGEQKTFDEENAAIWPDLDRPDLVAPYCDGVRAVPVPGGGDYVRPPLRDVQYDAPWAIVDSRPGGSTPSNPVRHNLHRCGLERPVKAPSSLIVAPFVKLGAGWVAWRPSAGRAVHVMRLADRRRYIIATSGFPQLLTAGSAWITDEYGAGPRRVALPRR